MRTSRWTSFALAGVIAAVLVTPARAQQVDIKPTQKVKHDKYVLTAEEIAERPDITNAYDAVRLLRPNFLKLTRSTGMLGQGASEVYRPPRDQTPKTDNTSTGSGTGTGTGSSIDPTKPDPSMSAGRENTQGTSPFGSSSGGSYVSAVLYIDEIKQPNIEELKNVRVADVVEVRYMTGTEASGRFGSGHEGGAILLKIKRIGRG